MSQIVASGLSKTYGRRTVVHDVSFEVGSGEVVGLLGPNGAGKTTCFYMVVGLVGADGGTVRLDDTDLTPLAMHQRARLGLSYLPQEPSIFRKLSVEDNIRAILELKRYSRDEREAHLGNLLDDLNIAHLRSAHASSLSGGERRRVEIARALAMNPRFVLLDEPFAGVDPIAVQEIQRLVRFLVERDIGVLVTDHNVRETLGICDRAYIVNEGRVLTSGVPEALIQDEGARKVYLGDDFRL